MPVIRGELQRHFRDRGWMVRPTRQIQELQWRSRGAATDLTQELGRTPTGDELARHLGVSRADYDRAQGAHGCFSPASLDQPLDSDATATVADTLGMVDTELSPLEARLVLGPALRRLQEEEQRIVHLRFFEELTQEEIGHEVGLSQPQVSRVLLRILSSLRTVLGEDLPQTA